MLLLTLITQIVLCLEASFVCPETILGLSSEMLTVTFCTFYNNCSLAKSHNYLAPNATITFRNFDPITGECLIPAEIPLLQWLPLIFSAEHTCRALIPVESTIGTLDSLHTVRAYIEHGLLKTFEVREAWFIFTQAPNPSGCNLLLQSITMRDLQCFGEFTSATSTDSTSTSTAATTTSGDGSGGSTTSSVTSRSRTTTSRPTTSTRSRPLLTDENYTTIVKPDIDSGDWGRFLLENDFWQAENDKICRFKAGDLRLILNPYKKADAEMACGRAGLRLARITRQNLRDAIIMTSNCLGPESSAWIKSYWRRMPKSACLEIVTGETSRTGGINETSDCSKLQPVICQNPYIEL